MSSILKNYVAPRAKFAAFRCALRYTVLLWNHFQLAYKTLFILSIVIGIWINNDYFRWVFHQRPVAYVNLEHFFHYCNFENRAFSISWRVVVNRRKNSNFTKMLIIMKIDKNNFLAFFITYLHYFAKRWRANTVTVIHSSVSINYLVLISQWLHLCVQCRGKWICFTLLSPCSFVTWFLPKAIQNRTLQNVGKRSTEQSGESETNNYS
jgi:hypothetical protein